MALADYDYAEKFKERNDRIIKTVENNQNIRNKAFELLVEIRNILKEQCPLPDVKTSEGKNTGGHIAYQIRTDIDERTVPPACLALAELDYVLYHLTDGIYYEVVHEFERDAAAKY